MYSSENIRNIAATYSSKPPLSQKKQQPSVFDKLSTNIKNSRDINDTVTVPRCIFKGYLCFMLSTATSSFASITQKYLKKTGKYILPILNTLSISLSTYGTYNFVKPFLFKNVK